MDIKTIPLSLLEAELRKTLRECADSGQPLLVEMPDNRRIAIQPLNALEDEDALIDELLEYNERFGQLLQRSKASARKPFEG